MITRVVVLDESLPQSLCTRIRSLAGQKVTPKLLRTYSYFWREAFETRNLEALKLLDCIQEQLEQHNDTFRNP